MPNTILDPEDIEMTETVNIALQKFTAWYNHFGKLFVILHKATKGKICLCCDPIRLLLDMFLREMRVFIYPKKCIKLSVAAFS